MSGNKDIVISGTGREDVVYIVTLRGLRAYRIIQ